MTNPPVILVFGAINQDEVARVAKRPAAGETVVTDSVEIHQGGKGANQAYSAAVAGGRDIKVQMVGAVGDDAAGEDAIASLHAAGVDTTLVKRVAGRPTGRAYIAVTPDGQNSILVSLGANGFVSPSNLVAAKKPDVAVAQSELGSTAVEALASFAAAVEARLIINNGPAVELSNEALSLADPLIVNEHEARDLLHHQDWGEFPEELATKLLAKCGSRSVVITLGANGSVAADSRGVRRHHAATPERVVDTTGAGDTFVGALAAGLALGEGLDQAIGRASDAAAQSVASRGARASLSESSGGDQTRSAVSAAR